MKKAKKKITFRDGENTLTITLELKCEDSLTEEECAQGMRSTIRAVVGSVCGSVIPFTNFGVDSMKIE